MKLPFLGKSDTLFSHKAGTVKITGGEDINSPQSTQHHGFDLSKVLIKEAKVPQVASLPARSTPTGAAPEFGKIRPSIFSQPKTW